MSITVNFAHHMSTEDRSFESFAHLRDFLRSIAFAPVYRMRSHENESGRIVSRELLALAEDSKELYLGNVVLEGDRQG